MFGAVAKWHKLLGTRTSEDAAEMARDERKRQPAELERPERADRAADARSTADKEK